MSLNEFILLDLLDTHGVQGELKLNQIKSLYEQRYSRELFVTGSMKKMVKSITNQSTILTVIKSPVTGTGKVLTRKVDIMTHKSPSSSSSSSSWNETALLELLDSYGVNDRLDLTNLRDLYSKHYNHPIPIRGKLSDAVKLIINESSQIELVNENFLCFLRRRRPIISSSSTSPQSPEPSTYYEQTRTSCKRLQNIKQLLDFIQKYSCLIIIDIHQVIKENSSKDDTSTLIQFGLLGSHQEDLFPESVIYDCPCVDNFAEVGDVVLQMFNSAQHQVYIHDAYHLKQYFKLLSVHEEDNILDIQLAMEYVYHLPFNNTIEQIAEFFQVNLPQNLMERLEFIGFVGQKFKDEINSDSLVLLHQASSDRVSNSYTGHRITFNISKGYTMSSKELLLLSSPTDCYDIAKPTFYNDVDDLLNLLPSGLQQQIIDLGTSNLTEICMDYGRPAFCWIGGKRYYLSKKDTKDVGNEGTTPDLIKKLSFGLLFNNFVPGETNDSNTRFLKDDLVDVMDENKYVVSKADLDAVISGVSTFGFDNRSGIEKKLHRISCMRNRDGNIIGLTLRVGRHIDGIASIVADLLLAQTKSILVLGEPGSGKTTVIRDMARLLSSKCNVVIVDTSNEIGGDGDIPHCCIGNARRIMVTKLPEQSHVMIECVQNHTPHVMIIDEIGRPQEVEAARTCKQRGVRMISSAHGSLRTLMKNSQLKGLIGGIEVVTVGDEAARRSSNGALNKLKPQRQGEPVFDLIIELTRENTHAWTVISDTAKAVDSILLGNSYSAEIRSRDPLTNAFSVRYDNLKQI